MILDNICVVNEKKDVKLSNLNFSTGNKQNIAAFNSYFFILDMLLLLRSHFESYQIVVGDNIVVYP